MGTIRLRAAGGVEARAGRHRLDVVNGHRRDTSVYMVNALVPDDGGVDIVSQSRDAHQREFHVEATVRPRWAMLLWFGDGRGRRGGVDGVSEGENERDKRRTKNTNRLGRAV